MRKAKNNSSKFDIIIPPQDIDCMPGLQEKLAEGNREAFAWIYANYCKKMYDYAMIMTGDEQKSEDIVQDVFLRLWLNKEKIRGHKNFSGYLTLMCRNHIINIFRGEKREKNRNKNYATHLIEGYNAVDDSINYNETYKLIQEAIKQLPKCQRLIFDMKQQGIDNQEIEAKLGIRPKTVWNQLQRAGKLLKERLNR